MTSQYLINNQLGNVNGVAQFSQGARTFVPQFNVCPARVATTQDGRLASAGSVNALTAPGCFSPLPIIQNENSLRPVLASNPMYKNIQMGVGGGIGTMFGAKLPGPANYLDLGYNIGVRMGNPAKKCDPNMQFYEDYNYDNSYDNMSCSSDNSVPLYGLRNSDTIATSLRDQKNFML
jgi:hypothetical protein